MSHVKLQRNYNKYYTYIRFSFTTHRANQISLFLATIVLYKNHLTFKVLIKFCFRSTALFITF